MAEQHGPAPDKGKERIPPVARIMISVAASAVIVAIVALVMLLFVSGQGIWLATSWTIEPVNDAAKKSTRASTTTFKVDEEGNPQTCAEAYGANTEPSLTTFGPFEDGRCLHSVNAKGTETDYVWELDDQGHATKVTVTDDDGATSTVSYEYNEEGFIAKRSVQYLVDGREILERYEFDTNGHIVFHEVVDGDDGADITYIYETDANGRIASCRVVETRKSTGKTTRESDEKCSYDDNGNMVRSTYDQIIYADDGTKTEESYILTYGYEHVSNPSPWTRQMNHLFMGTIMLT